MNKINKENNSRGSKYPTRLDIPNYLSEELFSKILSKEFKTEKGEFTTAVVLNDQEHFNQLTNIMKEHYPRQVERDVLFLDQHALDEKGEISVYELRNHIVREAGYSVELVKLLHEKTIEELKSLINSFNGVSLIFQHVYNIREFDLLTGGGTFLKRMTLPDKVGLIIKLNKFNKQQTGGDNNEQ